MLSKCVLHVLVFCGLSYDLLLLLLLSILNVIKSHLIVFKGHMIKRILNLWSFHMKFNSPLTFNVNFI